MIANDIILDNIISRLETRPLRKCLRVSLQFFHIAGKYLYAKITYPPDNGDTDVGRAAQRLFEGLNVSALKSLRDNPSKTSFKRILLGMVRQLTIKTHCMSITHKCSRGVQATRRVDYHPAGYPGFAQEQRLSELACTTSRHPAFIPLPACDDARTSTYRLPQLEPIRITDPLYIGEENNHFGVGDLYNPDKHVPFRRPQHSERDAFRIPSRAYVLD